MKKLGEIKIAWLVLWTCSGQNEDECLRKVGIYEKVADIISARKDFDQIIEIAKDIYKQKMLSFSKRIYLSNYSLGNKRKKEFFSTEVPVFTHYQSDVYRTLMKLIQEKGIKNKKAEKMSERWSRHPQFITVGHNPCLEITKVFNLSVSEDKNGEEFLEWDRLLASGNFKREEYRRKKINYGQ
ncbi:MAG: hypothetical protein PHV78_03395 [Patescibacteria group bacterium]|nr:hypothetical protein [Patescibacteria group bacterium]MDD5121568.1 hypothetical protein [Patescibacteria group bacterium]MDD5222242.1 hypothetical protein [Patescibacteria group bacterium]MDD5396268.1 hypothetical protein [Patescibacteria group bacterium]